MAKILLLILTISGTCPGVVRGVSPGLCLPMTDPTYDPHGFYAYDDVSEELRTGFFGIVTLYCERGCCGDNNDQTCCDPSDNVDEGQFETYKLLCIIVAGVGGITIIGVITLMMIKMHLKKRRLIRDIHALNKTNNVKSLAPKFQSDTNESMETKTKNKKPKVIKVESQPQVLAPVKQSPIHLKQLGSLPPPAPVIYDHITPTSTSPAPSQPAVKDISRGDKAPAYTDLDLSNFMDSKPTSHVGNLHIFLPQSLESSAAAPVATPKSEAPQAGNPSNHARSMGTSSETVSGKSTMPGSPLAFDDDEFLRLFSDYSQQSNVYKPSRAGY